MSKSSETRSRFFESSWRMRASETAIRASSGIAMLVLLSGCPVGTIDHVALDYVVGWSCDNENFARTVPIEIYATATTGDGTCIAVDEKTVCRVATGLANKRREASLADNCGGNSARGYRIRTPNYLLDGKTHEVIAVGLTADSPPKTAKLGGMRVFDSDVLYEQERITNIDDHILVDGGFPSPPAQQDADFTAQNHTLFVVWTGGLGPANPLESPMSVDGGYFTGFHPPEPFAQYQRGMLTGPPPVMAQAANSTVGVSVSPWAQGSPTPGVLIQHNWRSNWPGLPPPHPFRSGVDGFGDRLQVRGYFTHPWEYADQTTPSPPYSQDNMSFWYYVLVLKDTTTNHVIWFNVPAYVSRTARNPPWDDFSDGAHQYVSLAPPPGSSGPPIDTYVNMPLRTSGSLAPWVYVCPGSATFSQEPHADERFYCFELLGAWLSLIVEQEANPQRAAVGLPPLSPYPGDYQLITFVVNAEVFAYGLYPQSGLAFSVRGLAVERIPWS